MHYFINTLHSYNRYFILIALAYVLFRAWSGWMGKKSFDKADNSASVTLLGLAHLQLVLGLIQYFVTSAYTTGGLPTSDPWVRYFKMEHIGSMLVAIILIQLGRTLSKKATVDVEKHKKLAIYTTIATLLIVVTLAMKGLLFGTLATAAL